VAKGEPQGGDSGSGRSRLPRGRHGLPRELVARNQRERLIAGIIAAVAEHGYQETTIAAIVAAAELSRKTFYEHFANKEACFEAAHEASSGYLQAEIGRVAEVDDWGLTVQARLRRLLEVLSSESDLATFFLIASPGAGDAIAARHHEAMRELVAALTEGAPKPRGKREPLETRERALAGGLSRLVVRKLGAGEAGELPGLLPALTELVLWPYLGGEEAVRIAGEDT
jgi:AcrR family transcriptional regulator